MTYVWKVLQEGPWGKVDEIIEVTLKITEYDAFKEANKDVLERYMDTVPAISGIFGTRAAVLPNLFKDRLKQIRDNYPGAKNMLDDSKHNYVSEW